MEACELCQNLQLRNIDRNAGAARENLPCFSLHMFALHQKGNRLTAGVQRPPDYKRAFRDEQGVGRVGAVDKLVFRQTGVDVQLRCGKICNLYDVRHLHSSPDAVFLRLLY